jgi:hypothetical protein
VRVRDHVVLSSVGAVLLYPRLRGAVLGPWAASILIDADHYLWFCLRQRRLNPGAALRFFSQAQPPQQRQTRLLHSPAVLLGLLLLGRLHCAPTRRRPTTWALLGMAFHVGLDAYDTARRDHARVAALARDGVTCQQCGARGRGIVAHLWYQPCLLPSYHPEHLVSLCGACHEAAHAARRGCWTRGCAMGPAAPLWGAWRTARARRIGAALRTSRAFGAWRRDAVPLRLCRGYCAVGAILEIGARSHG